MDEAARREDALISERILARVQYLNETRGWPWMQRGVISVGLDEDGRVARYLATDDGFELLELITTHPV